MKKLLWPPTKTQIQNLPLEAVSVLVDPREQQPWDLSPMKVEEATLQTGDYCSACIALCWKERTLSMNWFPA